MAKKIESLRSKADEVLMVGVYIRKLDVNQQENLKKHTKQLNYNK